MGGEDEGSSGKRRRSDLAKSTTRESSASQFTGTESIDACEERDEKIFELPALPSSGAFLGSYNSVVLGRER